MPHAATAGAGAWGLPRQTRSRYRPITHTMQYDSLLTHTKNGFIAADGMAFYKARARNWVPGTGLKLTASPGKKPSDWYSCRAA